MRILVIWHRDPLSFDWRLMNMDLVTTAIVLLIVLWLLGVSFASSIGGIIHLLLVIVVILIAVRLLRGQPV